jgi:hypothetical protein
VKLTDEELNLILGAIDTLKCELIEQDYSFSETGENMNHEELVALEKLSNKLVTEKMRRKERKNAKT